MRKSTVALAMSFTACATTAAPAAQAPAGADAAAAEEVREQVDRTMGAFVAMDRAAFEAGLAEDVVGFEMDLEGKPTRLGSRADALRFADGIFAEMKKMGASMRLDVHAARCDAEAAFAYCTVEFDFVATMPDGTKMTQPSRNTMALRRTADGWRWTHWHSSLAVAPAAPAAAAAVPAPAAAAPAAK